MNNANALANEALIPVLTTPAGTCLTTENWQEAGVSAASFHLASLLLKPGASLLQQLPSLSAYTGWPKTTILNASMPVSNKEGVYTLRSPYDGSYVHQTIDQLLALIIQLNPQIVIFPRTDFASGMKVLESLPESIFPFFSYTDVPSNTILRPYGVYFSYEKTMPLTSFIEELKHVNHVPRYVAGDLDLATMQVLVNEGVDALESNLPAADACEGKVYCNAGVLSLDDPRYAMEFKTIDAQCQCPTCGQAFTQAYLHHLLLQTPLLCQRLLIQHNLYFARSSLVKRKLLPSSFT